MRVFVRDLFSVYATLAVNGALSVVFVPVAVAWLGTAGYGLFSIYGALVGCLALAELGTGKNLARLLASDPTAVARCRRLQVALSLYISLAGILLLTLPAFLWTVENLLFPVQPQYRPVVRWIGAISLVEYCLAIPTALRQTFAIGTERLDRYSHFQFVSGLYRYGLMFAGVLAFHSPVAVVALVAARRFADLFVAPRLMGDLPPGAWRPRFAVREMRAMLTDSTVLSAAQGLQTAGGALASILVNRYFGIVGLGVYRSAFDLASRVWLFSNGLGLVVFPRFARLLADKENRGKLLTQMRVFVRASWIAYNLLAAAGVLAAPLLMPLFRREQGIIAIFTLLFLALCINGHANVSNELVLAGGRYALAAAIYGVALTILLLAFALLKPVAGLLAAGWAWLISQAIFAALMDAAACSGGSSWGRTQLRLLAFKGVVLVVSITPVCAYFGFLPAIFQHISLALLSVLFLHAMRQLRLKEAWGTSA